MVPKLSRTFSHISLNDSDSGYTEHLVETKFHEVTFLKPKEIEKHLQLGLTEEQATPLGNPCYNKLNYNPIKYARETFRSTADTMSSSPMPLKQADQKNCNRTIDTMKYRAHHIPKSPQLINFENKQCTEKTLRKISPKTSYHCCCQKGIGSLTDSKQPKSYPKKKDHQNIDDKLFTEHSQEQINSTSCEKQHIDASVNTDLQLVKPNTHLINVVSSQEEKNIKISDCINKLCQIQELPKVVIRPNFTKQIGPIIDIKTSKPSLQKNNVAVVECVYGGAMVDTKGNTSINVVHEGGIDIASQTISPPAVHFKNSRDLKLLKVTKDLLGKLNFKDGINVDKLKRSLINLVSLLNQISPIHVANLKLTSFDAASASESIDTFFSNIDLVTEIIENEIKKPTGRYSDYPECLIKAVDLLCGNIRSIFVIEDAKKRTAKSFGVGKEKRRAKKPSLAPNRKQLRTKKTDIAHRPSSATSSVTSHEKTENISERSKHNNPPGLYIPYQMLIPGGKHKAMEEAKSSQDIELRFKRLEKVLEINQSLKETIPSGVNSESQFIPSPVKEEKSSSNIDHILNETFVIKSASEDTNESEITPKKHETKTNKLETDDYEDDWEVESSKSNDGSMAMTEIKVAAQVHSSEVPTSFTHSSPKKLFLSKKSSQELTLTSKGSQTENTESLSSHPSFRESQSSLAGVGLKDIQVENRQSPDQKKINVALKDVETQYCTGKQDRATMYCGDFIQNQKPKVDIIEPLSAAVEAASFTVLRMTNPSTNSLLEVRFPEQSEKIQSSLTVQKSHNSEEVKLLYNLNKDEKISSCQELNKGESHSIPTQIIDRKQESFLTNPSNIIDKTLPKCIHHTDKESSLHKREELNDFQNITTNFIQFLESKVNEMVSKFKLSEVTCEKVLDQKLTCNLEHQTSANNFLISSSKNSLKNEIFYKSASSLFSNQSNEDVPVVRNLLYQRHTPDNQNIIPFENLTSPPLGLQFKEASNLNISPNIKTEGLKANSYEDRHADLITSNNALEMYSYDQNSCENLEKNDNITTYENTKQTKLVLKDNIENINSALDGFQNRLLPLPEDIINNKIIRHSNKEMEKESFIPSSTKNCFSSEPARSENYNPDSSVFEEAMPTPSSKNTLKTTSEQLGVERQKNSSLFEETVMALMTVEQTYEEIGNDEESTVMMARMPEILSKNVDEVDSQRTSISHTGNTSPAYESGKFSSATSTSKISFLSRAQPHELGSLNKVTIEVPTDQEHRCTKVTGVLSMDKDFPKLLPTSETANGVKESENESLSDSSVNIHSLIIRGPSHIDKSLDSVDFLSKGAIENFEELIDDSLKISSPNEEIIKVTCDVMFDNKSQLLASFQNDTAVQSTVCEYYNNSKALSNGAAIQAKVNEPLEDPPQLSIDATIQTADCESLDHASQTLSPPLDTDNISFHNFPQISNDEDFQTSYNVPMNREDISKLSDDFTQLNYYNPEEMSDGEIGFVYTSNSYSSGEIKPCYEQNDDDSLTEAPTCREVNQQLPDCAIIKMNGKLREKAHIRGNDGKTVTSVLQTEFGNTIEINQTEGALGKENSQDIEVFSSSNDSTSTGELKNLFNNEEKIDEGLLGKLIDIHIHCSTRISSESSGHDEFVENKDEEV